MVWQRGAQGTCNGFLKQRRKGTKPILEIKNNLFFAPLRLCARYFSTPRARNDYSTHVPVLIGLARLREIRNVLELGCGHYSTLTFLNRAAFPHLERLHSIENDNVWAETISDVAKHDERWTLTSVTGEISDSAATLDLEAFDLILIDDSKTATQRVATIRAISAKAPQHPWILIHDFEVEDYRHAASGFKHKHSFKSYNPWTGLVCNHTVHRVKSLDRLLKTNSKTLEPDDIGGWLRSFSDPSTIRLIRG